MNIWLKQVLCFHRYCRKAKKSNFYGEVVLSKCDKCDKEEVVSTGYPDMGLPSKTEYTHYE